MALFYCLLIAFRPLPNIYDDNDTGRYVEAFHEYCNGSEFIASEGREISYNLFYWVTSPPCLVGSERLFLLEVALFVPLIFLLFVKWREGICLWAYSLIFSVAGLEMMINAFRQSFATLLFFFAIAMVKRHNFLALILTAIAAFAHSVAFIYSPLLIWMILRYLSTKTLLFSGLIFLILSAIFYKSIEVYIEWFIDSLLNQLVFYEQVLNPSFIALISLPIFFVYGIRHFRIKEDALIEEKTTFLYSVAILLISYIYFPAILYRLAIFGVAIQIFLAARSDQQDIISGRLVLFSSLAQLTVMFIYSNNYRYLFYG